MNEMATPWGFYKEDSEDTTLKNPQVIKEDVFDYYIDIEKGITVAVMKDPIKYFETVMWYRYARKTLPVDGVFGGYYPRLLERFKEPIKAKTTLIGEDTFSVEKGMKIAKEKCLEKFYRKCGRIFNEIWDVMYQYSLVATDFRDTSNSIAEKYKNKRQDY